jgi:hypothetical protein
MRGFLGSFGGGNSGLPKKSAASAEMRQQIQKGGKIKESADEKMKKMVQQKIDELQKAVMDGTAKKFMMPGAKAPEKAGMSKSAKKMMEMIAAKKAKKEMKALAQQVVIKPKSFSGGRLDADGKVYDSMGKLVATIDPKNGNIKNAYGVSVGKYKGDMMGNNKIANMITSSGPRNTSSSTAGVSSGISLGNFYGHDDKKDDSWW